MGNILFFCRGRGFGHVTRDLVIGQAISAKTGNNVLYASYATGLRAFELYGVDCIDLALPSVGADSKRIESIVSVIDAHRPSLVIADEELLAIPISKGFGTPAVLITNWFPPGTAPSALEACSQADVILFPDLPGVYDVPEGLDPVFVGPVKTVGLVNSLTRLGTAAGEQSCSGPRTILVTLGGSPGVAELPLFHLCIRLACELGGRYRFILIAGQWREALSKVVEGMAHVEVVGYTSEITMLCAAADVVVTRGGHTTLWELAMLGVPSISVTRSPQINPMAPLYAQAMEKLGTTLHIPQAEVTLDRLAALIERALDSREFWQEKSKQWIDWNGEEKIVDELLSLGIINS